MNPRMNGCATAVFALALVSAAAAHQDDKTAQGARKDYGQVLFKTSCTAEAQKQFERALAMLHSFYFPETVKAFNAIPETDPGVRDRLLGHRDRASGPIRWSGRGTPRP